MSDETNDNGQHSAGSCDQEVLRDIDTIISELKITDPLQDEWAKAVREHSRASVNDSRQDRLLYMAGYTLLAKARLLAEMDQVVRDSSVIAGHLHGGIGRE